MTSSLLVHNYFYTCWGKYLPLWKQPLSSVFFHCGPLPRGVVVGVAGWFHVSLVVPVRASQQPLTLVTLSAAFRRPSALSLVLGWPAASCSQSGLTWISLLHLSIRVVDVKLEPTQPLNQPPGSWILASATDFLLHLLELSACDLSCLTIMPATRDSASSSHLSLSSSHHSITNAAWQVNTPLPVWVYAVLLCSVFRHCLSSLLSLHVRTVWCLLWNTMFTCSFSLLCTYCCTYCTCIIPSLAESLYIRRL